MKPDPAVPVPTNFPEGTDHTKPGTTPARDGATPMNKPVSDAKAQSAFRKATESK